MFIGHYGISFGAKPADRSVPLWVLFLAVQFLDVLWGIFVLTGIERVRIIPGFTATNPLDLYYMPWSHGLFTSAFWALLAGFAYRSITKNSRGGWIVGIAVFSHWILDWLVHVPDLPLIGDRFKIGLGLWNYPAFALALEVAFLSAGLYLYLRATQPIARRGPAGFLIFVLLMIAVQVVTFFGSPPSTPAAAATTALAAYFVLAAIAGWLEKRRLPPAIELPVKP